MKRIGVRTKFVVLFVVITVALLALNIVWRGYVQREQAEREMLENTQVLATEMDAVWDFMERNQVQFKQNEDGTYNLYCVVAAKAVSRMFTVKSDGYIIHYTNLTTRKADDAPDEFETRALEALHANPDLEAYYALEKNEDGSQVFRYVEPLLITESCLECHGDPKGELDIMGYPKEGQKVGDIAGAASIIMPADSYISNINVNIIQESAIFLVFILVGLAAIFYGFSKLVTVPMERQNRQLAEDNQYKSDFLAIMSHEIRTPLTSILAFADIWARSNVPRNADEEKIMREMQGNSQLLLAMVNNILEMAKVEAGRKDVLLEPIDMADLVNAVKGSTSFLAEKKNVTLTATIDRAVPVVFIDSEKVRRILENLISNAIKFVDEQGSVEVHVAYEVPHAQLILTVTDDGCGIKDEDVAFIFDRFVQGSDSSTYKHGGSGLGLALVRELAELHGGTVEVQTALGQGSTFTVRLTARASSMEEL